MVELDFREDAFSKYRSRKWILTLLILFVASVFSYMDMLTPQFSNVLLSLGVSYNGFQGLIDWQSAR